MDYIYIKAVKQKKKNQNSVNYKHSWEKVIEVKFMGGINFYQSWWGKGRLAFIQEKKTNIDSHKEILFEIDRKEKKKNWSLALT